MKRIFVISGGLFILGMIPLSMMSGGTKEPAKPLQLPTEKENVISPGKPIFIPVAEKPKFAHIPKPVIDEDEGSAKEQTLAAALKENDGFQKVAEIENVSCQGKTCTIMASAHGETNEDILNSIIKFLQTHPEYGLRFSKDDVKDDPKLAVITITKE